MVNLLMKKPSNAKKIAETLNLDYKTVRHDWNVLEKNNIITAVNKGGYGAVYFLSYFMQSNINIFHEILAQFGKK